MAKPAPRRTHVVVANALGLSLVLGVVGLVVMAAQLAGHYGVAFTIGFRRRDVT
ncbi:MAG: hypothetical protein M3O55_04880 [Actinomycetota bacterium]|nr:hypothetical protein [Actinomycetota bacterium]